MDKKPTTIPLVPISSAKVDGDFNYIIDVLNIVDRVVEEKQEELTPKEEGK